MRFRKGLRIISELVAGEGRASVAGINLRGRRARRKEPMPVCPAPLCAGN